MYTYNGRGSWEQTHGETTWKGGPCEGRGREWSDVATDKEWQATPAAPEVKQAKNKFFFRTSGMSMATLISLFSMSGIQNSERINFRCFRPSDLLLICHSSHGKLMHIFCPIHNVFYGVGHGKGLDLNFMSVLGNQDLQLQPMQIRKRHLTQKPTDQDEPIRFSLSKI